MTDFTIGDKVAPRGTMTWESGVVKAVYGDAVTVEYYIRGEVRLATLYAWRLRKI